MEKEHIEEAMSDPLWTDFIQKGAAAIKDHTDMWYTVRKLIERDIVNGRPAVEIAQAVALLQHGENMIYNMYPDARGDR